MEENKGNGILLIDDVYEPALTFGEAEKLKPILKDFIRECAKNNQTDVRQWLPQKVQSYLPEMSKEEALSLTDEITKTIQASETAKTSLAEAKKKGVTRDSWLSDRILESTSGMSQEQTVHYLAGLDDALARSNEAMLKSVTTNAGNINQNPRLDGFIAEQYHAETFNLNAAAKGSKYRAEALKPNPGERFGENSVDILVKEEGSGLTNSSRYQSKYYKNAEKTQTAFENGDYRGQQKLVPSDQLEEIQKKGVKATDVLVAPDGTTSKPLSKEEAERLRDEAQNGELPKFDWNEFEVKDLAKQVGAQAGLASLQGAAISTGFDIAHKLWEGEEIDIGDEVKVAIEGGVDFGVKSAAGAALKIGAEKGILKFIPKGTPAATCANIAFVGIENCKILAKVGSGELTPREGVDKMADATASTVGGLLAMGEGAAIGSKAGAFVGGAIGSFFGLPGVGVGLKVGSVVGGFVGGSVGYMAGSKVGQTVYKAAKKVVPAAVTAVKQIANTVINAGKGIVNMAKAGVNFVKNLFA